MAGNRTARERSVRGEGAVDVADAVAAGRRAIDALELHGSGRCDHGFVLLDRTAGLEDPHLVAIRDGAARCAVIMVFRVWVCLPALYSHCLVHLCVPTPFHRALLSPFRWRRERESSRRDTRALGGLVIIIRILPKKKQRRVNGNTYI